MTTAFNWRVLAGLTALTIAGPLAAYADHHHHDNHHDDHRFNNNKNYYKQVQKVQKRQYNNYRKAAHAYDKTYWHSHWGNNWNNQREWYTHNFRKMQARAANERQRELEAQMRAEYLAYHNNSYTGPYSWDLYSEPGFLDYLHSRRPNLLGTVRSILGI